MTLEEMTKEIENLEQERQQKDIERANALGEILKIQDELGGNIFGIIIPKDSQNFNEEKWNQRTRAIFAEISHIEDVFANPEAYPNFTNITFNLTEEKFNEIVMKLNNAIRNVDRINTDMYFIWQKQKTLGKNKTEKMDVTVPGAMDKIDVINKEIENLENQLSVYNEALSKETNPDLIDSLNKLIQNNKQQISTRKGKITKIYSNEVSKEDIEFYEKKLVEDENKLKAEKEKQERAAKIAAGEIKVSDMTDEEKQAKFEEIRNKKAEMKKLDDINKELDEAEANYYANAETTNSNDPTITTTPADLQAGVTPTPADLQAGIAPINVVEEAKKFGKKITRAGKSLIDKLNGKKGKALAVVLATAAIVAGFAAGVTFFPEVALGALGAYGYKEIKKGMGR